ncbi:uncharacterized protein N7483_011268 [Penicillium malachiteum]|uniref:uncharacterized protein n=1 Tax=Penicillium malachiteum TaxID=1324776 RepID=UPI0025498F4F|nr:uncharacterized protein N7483_011268 [Penicillium malachiteum]KAJ5714087.1 hypothetical protein N7483_011268 [Penicillium malachiteum]
MKTEIQPWNELSTGGYPCRNCPSKVSAADYYFLKNAYTSSSCDSKTSGTVVDGYCYTLNYPWATRSVASDSTFTSE